jgi:hypothetical protein
MEPGISTEASPMPTNVASPASITQAESQSDTQIENQGAEAEVSAADYDPSQDKAEDEERLKRNTGASKQTGAVAANVADDDDLFNPAPAKQFIAAVNGSAKKQNELDMFGEDDMFASEAPAKQETSHVSCYMLPASCIIMECSKCFVDFGICSGRPEL